MVAEAINSCEQSGSFITFYDSDLESHSASFLVFNGPDSRVGEEDPTS